MPPEASAATTFDPTLDIRLDSARLAIQYGPEAFGPEPEYRRLDNIRASLRDPGCIGPDPVYAIAMDVGRVQDAHELHRRMLLFGAVAYAAGTLGDEPVRSQGHVHKIAPHCGWSTPELFEIWEGRAIVYAQENAGEDPGRCIAVEAGPGEQVVVPPGWAHAVINADPAVRMLVGACCDRQYGFEYGAIRAHGGLAWFPIVRGAGIEWERNPSYRASQLVRRKAREYAELALLRSVPIYEQFVHHPESVQWVSEPERCAELWRRFEP